MISMVLHVSKYLVFLSVMLTHVLSWASNGSPNSSFNSLLEEAKVFKHFHVDKEVHTDYAIANPTVPQSDQLRQFINAIPLKEDTIQSVFRYIAETIKYDVALLDRPMEAVSRDELVDYVIRKKKGVCEHYSELLHRVLRHFGYTTYLVSGYTRRDGKLDTQLGHTWIVLYHQGEWSLLDVTWAAGYLQSGKFVARYDETWYKIPRQDLTRYHIPFDPLWQLTDTPISHEALKLQPASKPEVSSTTQFERTLQEELKMTPGQAAERQAARIRSAGAVNRLILKQLSYLDLLVKAGNAQSDVDRINQGVDLFNAAVKQFNAYQVAKTKALKAKSIPTYESLEQLSFAKAQAQEAKQLFDAVSIRDASITGNLKDLKRNTTLLLKEMQKEEDWLQGQLQ